MLYILHTGIPEAVHSKLEEQEVPNHEQTRSNGHLVDQVQTAVKAHGEVVNNEFEI